MTLWRPPPLKGCEGVFPDPTLPPSSKSQLHVEIVPVDDEALKETVDEPELHENVNLATG